MKRAIILEETLKPNETSEHFIKRFFRKCKKQDIVSEYLEKTSYFKSKRQKRREKNLRSKYLRQFEKNT